MDNQKKDFQKHYNRDPEPGFSPEHNKFVVENSIKKHEINMKKRDNEYNDRLMERVEAAETWLKYKDQGGELPIDKYFKSRMMAYLKAEQVKSAAKKQGLALSSLN